MKTTVVCRRTDDAVLSFFLITGGNEYYLFNQGFRKGVNSYFRLGVSLDDAMNFGKCRKDAALMRTMDKLPMYIKYIEREYGIAVLKKTAGKSRKPSAEDKDFYTAA